MQVVHAFLEDEGVGQDLHLRYWYGTVSPSDEVDEDPDMPVVCWCGAKQVSFGSGVAAVWHLQAWDDRGR